MSYADIEDIVDEMFVKNFGYGNIVIQTSEKFVHKMLNVYM